MFTNRSGQAKARKSNSWTLRLVCELLTSSHVRAAQPRVSKQHNLLTGIRQGGLLLGFLACLELADVVHRFRISVDSRSSNPSHCPPLPRVNLAWSCQATYLHGRLIELDALYEWGFGLWRACPSCQLTVHGFQCRFLEEEKKSAMGIYMYEMGHRCFQRLDAR